MKNKILTLLIIAIFIVSIMSVNSFAAITSGTVSLTASKSSYNLDDENEIITVTLKLSNLKSTNGIIAYSGVLEYDKSKLTYLDRAGAGLWAPPSYSDENGKLIADRADNDFSGDEEVLCTFRFKPKAAGDNIVIKLSNIELSSGELGGKGSKKINDAQVSINIKSATQPSNPGDDNKPSNPGDDNKPSNPGDDNKPSNPGSDDNNNDSGNNNGDNNNNQDNGNSGSGTDSGSNENGDGKTDKQNNSQKDDSNPNKSNSIIPKLGTSTYVLIVIGIALVIAIIFFVRMKLLDRKIKRRHRRR